MNSLFDPKKIRVLHDLQIMIRTRDVGHTLSMIIDRGRQDEDDVVDVPQRCRPIASARRQRVHHMIKDVPHMIEDVPHMAEDAPEMTADVQADDGVEGSHADDAEGFAGGPRDPSVLTSFADHVAHAVSSGHVF